MLTEEKAIAVINELIDADMRTGAEMVASDLARRAIARLGEGVIDEKAVADLVGQVFTARFEPWMALPGAKPRLKGWGERVVRLTPKPTPMDILYEGQEAGEPLEATFARIGAAYPELTGDEMQAVIQDYQAWLQNRIERQKALARRLDRVRRIVRPAMDEDPSLTIGEAMRVMAGRGCEAAQRELGRWREMERANEAAGP